jgi:hypothetical protein
MKMSSTRLCACALSPRLCRGRVRPIDRAQRFGRRCGGAGADSRPVPRGPRRRVCSRTRTARSGGVRREINWDAVPSGFAAPNNLPANFFNVNSPRGVVLSTPGTGFQVSASSSDVSGQPLYFGNIDFSYSANVQRLFAAAPVHPVGQHIYDVNFIFPARRRPRP